MTWLVFTWPSDGSMLPFKAYASDRDDARASGVALGRGLQKLASFLSGIRPEVSSIPICGIEPTSAQGAVRRKGRSIAAHRAVNNLRMRRIRPRISA